MRHIDPTLGLLEKIRAYVDEHDEGDFQARLAARLEAFGWRVWREVMVRETPSGQRRRIDMIAEAPLSWPYRGEVSAIGVEAKMNRDLGTHMDESTGKLNDYIQGERWYAAGVEVPKPAIVLYATPFSVGLSYAVYDWNDRAFRDRIKRQTRHLLTAGADRLQEAQLDLCQLEAICFVFERMLWKRRSAILHGPWGEDLWFQSNRLCNGMRVSLNNRAAKAA